MQTYASVGFRNRRGPRNGAAIFRRPHDFGLRSLPGLAQDVESGLRGGPRGFHVYKWLIGSIMRPNAFFPSLDIGTDPAKIRDWAQAAEDLGYAYIEVPDHVFGAKGRDGWVPLYNEKDPFHETFVTLGFLAAVTKTIGLSTGILIAPQRQTGVIAKQAAEVDVLSGGRLRLGIGLGWNHVEYEALGMEWETRGARQAEQVEVLRLLWSKDLVTFEGRFHRLKDVIIVPVRDFAQWGLSQAGQNYGAQLGYLPLSDDVIDTGKQALDELTH